MGAVCGKYYKCKRSASGKSGVSVWSYTKGKIYHSMTDGYLTDDHNVSWSCTDEFIKENFIELKQ